MFNLLIIIGIILINMSMTKGQENINSDYDSYTLIPSLMSRDEAKTACNALGAELASIHCQRQNDEIRDLLNSLGSSSQGHIGYNFVNNDDLSDILFDDGTSYDFAPNGGEILNEQPAAYYVVIGDYQRSDEKPTECKVYSKRYGNAENVDDNYIAVTCCDSNGVGSRPDCNALPVNYIEAEAVCTTAGLRLCSKDEIESLAGKGGGCSFDARHVWTSTPCTDIDIAQSHMIIIGDVDDWGADKPPECTPNSNNNGIGSNSYGTKIGVTCCDDSGIGIRPNCDIDPANYYEAEVVCNGTLHICSMGEIQNGAGQGTGCSYDAYHVWTSNVCNININTEIAHWTIVGDPVNYGTDKLPECTINSNNNGIAENDWGTKIGVTCCDDSGSGTRPDCDADPATYDEAVAVCTNNGGLRLCEQQEIINGAGDGGGCSYDAYHVWTKDLCYNNIDCVAINANDGSWNQINCDEKKYPICNNLPINTINTCSTLSPTPAPTDLSLPSNNHDLFCGADNDKPTWTAILSLDQDTLNLLHSVKGEEEIKSIQEYIMCSEFIYNAVVKNAAVQGPTNAIKLANEILKLLQQIPGIGDDISDGVDDMSQFIVDLLNILTPDECSIEWGDEWDPDGTIFNPFEKLEALGDFLSAKVCDALIGEKLKILLESLRDSEAITSVKDAFINNMETFLNDQDNNLFNNGLKDELLLNDFYKEFSFAITIGMQICFSKGMNGCITRQHGVSMNLRGNAEIFESRSMFVEFPVMSVGLSTAGYVHFDLLSNYLDIINKEISLNVGVFLNVPGSDTISKFMDLWGEHSQRLDDIPIIGDTASIGVDFVDGVIEDNPLIVDILTGGANARLAIIYTFSDNDKINCNGFRIALSVGDVDTSFGGGVFFGYEYRKNDVRNIQQNIDWLDDVNHAAFFSQFGNAVLDLSKELLSIFEDAMEGIGTELKQIGEDVVDETKSQFVGILNGFLDGFEIIANVGVAGVNGAITGLNEGINGVNTGINGAIDGVNTALNGAISGANTLIDTANTVNSGINTAINSANSAVNTVSSKFDSANSALTTAKNECKKIDDNCWSTRICIPYPCPTWSKPWKMCDACESVGACVRDIVSLDGGCNTIFNAVSAPMDLLQDGIDAIPDIPTIGTISRITNSVDIDDIAAFDNIDPIDDVNIADIPAAKQAPINLNEMIDDDNDIEIIKFDKPDLVITIPSKITSLIFLYTIIIILIGYGLGIIEEKIWMKNGKKHNKQRYFSVNDTEISEVSDTDC